MIHTSFKSPITLSWEKYYKYKIDILTDKFVTKNPEYFEKSGKKMAINLFHQMSKRVPAYKDFLIKNKISPNKIKTFKDMKHVPWVDKKNYLNIYSLEELAWDGKFSPPIISASSGTSGTPTFWPRSNLIELETTYIYELFLKSFYSIDKQKTLLINGFAMGIYVGGSFTLTCSMRLSKKGYPLTIVTPGMNKKEIIDSYQNLYKHFDQVIIGTYPPLLRDILDEMEDAKMPLKSK